MSACEPTWSREHEMYTNSYIRPLDSESNALENVSVLWLGRMLDTLHSWNNIWLYMNTHTYVCMYRAQ
jgi:hypothetical protein